MPIFIISPQLYKQLKILDLDLIRIYEHDYQDGELMYIPKENINFILVPEQEDKDSE